MKTIAMYLPQFHQIPENDEWWGAGYTEWTAVKQAEQLFDGHEQPKEPLNQNYYNLLEKQTMQQQAMWMREYSIDGLCFYHYYFKDGRKILEKPAENLLKWEDIQMPFCFCWANEAWARTWSNITDKNAWADKFENAETSEKEGILIDQKYGREKEWKAHFQYLLPFFKDERYMKHNDAPIFLIYKPDDICNLYQMSEYWKALAYENGLKSIYFIGVNVYSPKKGLDAILFSMPAAASYGKNLWSWEKGTRTANYDVVWNNMFSLSPVEGCKTYYGGFVNYDDTPRRGKNGIAITGFSIESFKENLYRLFKKNMAMKNEYLFINAWNEWGEGMYLEPDEEYGFRYLEAVGEVKQRVLEESVVGEDEGTVAQGFLIEELSQDQRLLKTLNKHKMIANCFDQWMALREKKINIATYLEKHAYFKVAIYGMGILGRHLLYDLEQSNVEVAYAIDKRSDLNCVGLEVYGADADLQPVDAIVVTAVAEYDEIYDDMKTRVECPIISLYELIKESF